MRVSGRDPDVESHTRTSPDAVSAASRHGGTATQSFTITVATVNDLLNARGDSARADERTSVSACVLGNDCRPNSS